MYHLKNMYIHVILHIRYRCDKLHLWAGRRPRFNLIRRGDSQCHLVKNDINAKYRNFSQAILLGFISNFSWMIYEKFRYYKKTDLHLPNYDVL